MPYLHGHFPQKSPIISGSLSKNDLQLEASYDLSYTVNTFQKSNRSEVESLLRRFLRSRLAISFAIGNDYIADF